MQLRYWTCGSCGLVCQGIVDTEGDFISDGELSRPRRVRATGCPECGYPEGTFGEEVDEEATP
jgi:hypothetical protein